MAAPQPMTLLALAQRLWRESGRTGPGPAALATAVGPALRMFEAIQDVWRDLQIEPMNWRWMRATTTGALVVNQVQYTPTQAGATDLAQWWAEGGDYRPYLIDPADATITSDLSFLPFEEFRNRYMRGTQTASQPRHWSIATNGDLLLGPKPDATYGLRIDYEKLPSELSADADTPNMPARFHMLLVWRALERRIAIQDSNAERLAIGLKEAASMHSALVTDQGESPTDSWAPLA